MHKADGFAGLRARIRPSEAEARAALRLALVFYAFTLVIFVAAGFFRDKLDIVLLIAVPKTAGDALISSLLFFLLRMVSHLTPPLRWGIVAMGVVVVALLQAAWDTQLRLWAGADIAPYLAYIRAATLNVYNAGMFAALLAFQASNLKLSEQQRLLEASQKNEREAHMLALRFQLNPHFLFNSLNAISSMVLLGREDDANKMIDGLSSFLRASLAADPHGFVTLEEEFEMLETYLEIEGVRFGDRLIVEFDLPSEICEAEIPPFLLQPLVENAIKYAVAPSKRPVKVSISAAARDGELALTVADDGDGGSGVAPGTGVGLVNVRERLRLNYGARGAVTEHQDRSGFKVEIRLPLRLGPNAAKPREAAFA